MWVYYGDTGRVEGDDATRTATTYDAAGVMTGTRPHHPRGLGSQRRHARRVDRQRPRLTSTADTGSD